MDKLEVGFYVDFKWDTSCNSIISALLDKHFEKYVVGKEIAPTGVRHLQCWTLGYTQNSYTNFIAKVKKLYNLNGRANENTRKQYGRIKNVIKSTDSMISYCLKEKRGYWSKGLEQDYIDERLEASYTKELNKQDKFKAFILETSIAIADDTIDVDSFETNYEKHVRQLRITTKISELYFKHYDNVVPNTQVDKILLLLNLQTHEQLAKQKFRHFIEWNF